MCDHADNGHPSPQVVHKEKGDLWNSGHAQPGSELEVCPQYPQPLLPLGESKSESKDLAQAPVVHKRTYTDEAAALVREWWARQDPRPIQSFVVICQVATRALNAGWSPMLLLEAMDNVPTISARWLEGYVNRQKKGAQPDRLAAVKRMLESDT